MPAILNYAFVSVITIQANPSDMNFKQGTRGSLVSMLRYDSADIMRVEISSSISAGHSFLS